MSNDRRPAVLPDGEDRAELLAAFTLPGHFERLGMHLSFEAVGAL